MHTLTKPTIALAALPLLLLAQPAAAGSTTGQMPVSAQVLENCSVASTPMAFGSITDVGAANVDTTATITLRCTANATFVVLLDDGVNANAGQRRMANVTTNEFLPYEIYKDETRSDRWGKTPGSDTVSGSADLLGSASITAYGRIAKGVSKVSAGSYTDTVTITVNF